MKTSYLFILTDGIFSNESKENLKNILRCCKESLIEVIGIGIGFYPFGICSIFSKWIWSVDPNSLMLALSKLFDSSLVHTQQSIECYLPSIPNLSSVKSIFDGICSKWPEPCVYKKLYKILSDQILYSQSIDKFQKEVDGIYRTFI